MFPDPGAAAILSRGIRTSLLVRSEPDAASRTGVASFVLEIRAGAMRAEDLLPANAGRITARWDFAALPSAEAAFAAGPPATLTVPWAGKERATARHAGPRGGFRFGGCGTGPRAEANAWAALAFALLVLVRTGPARRRGGPARGCSPSQRGSSPPGLRSSPEERWRSFSLASWARPPLRARRLARLVRIPGRARRHGGRLLSRRRHLRALHALRRWRRGRRSALIPLAAIVLFGTAVLVLLATSLSRDARVRVPRLDLGSPGSLLLALAAACFIVGVAEAAATFAGRPRRLAVAAMLVPLSLLFLVQVHRTFDRMLDERLRVEFAPLVLEQSARRRVALTAAVGEAASSASLVASLASPHAR